MKRVWCVWRGGGRYLYGVREELCGRQGTSSHIQEIGWCGRVRGAWSEDGRQSNERGGGMEGRVEDTTTDL